MNKKPTKAPTEAERAEKLRLLSIANHRPGREHRTADFTVYKVSASGAWIRVNARRHERATYPVKVLGVTAFRQTRPISTENL